MGAMKHKERRTHCMWRLDSDSESWDTDCDHKFATTDGEWPSEHGMEYCCFCGRRIYERQSMDSK